MTTHVMTHDRPNSRHATTAAAARNGMAGGLPTGANDIVHSHVLNRCAERLQVKYGNDLESGLIRRTVQQAYRELEASARLKTFLPITAANLAEDRLRELASEARDGRSAVDPVWHEAAGEHTDAMGTPERAAA